MKMQLLDKVLDVSAKMTAEGVKFPNTEPTDWTLHNEFSVSIKCDGRRMSFKYYGSHADYEASRRTLEGKDLWYAVHSSLDDSARDLDTVDKFIQELGYEIHSAADFRRAERTFKACKAAERKWERLLPDIDLVEAFNFLLNAENENRTTIIES